MLSLMNEVDPCLLLSLCILYEMQNQFFQPHQYLVLKIYVVDFNNVRPQILSKWLLIYYFSKSKKLLINERHFLFRYHLSFSFLFFLPPLYVSYMMAYYYNNSYIYVWHWDLSILFSTCQMQWVGAIITSVY